MNELDNEKWESIPEAPGYEVSNLGRVRSIDRVVSTTRGGTFPAKGRILIPNNNSKDYLQVKLCTDGRVHRCHYVHRLVAKGFITNPDRKTTVNHIDGNKCNNRADNLEWATMSENALHKFHVLKHQANKPMLGLKGVLSPLRKKIQTENNKGQISQFECAEELAIVLGISKSYCMMLARGISRENYFLKTGLRITYTPTV